MGVELDMADDGGCTARMWRKILAEYRLSKTVPNCSTLQWFESPPTASPKPWFPSSPRPNRAEHGPWTMGQDIDPNDVVKNGGRKLHAFRTASGMKEKRHAAYFLDAPGSARRTVLWNFDNARPIPTTECTSACATM